MKNIVKKLLITTAAFIVMSGSLGVGTLRVLAEQVEQYYGWNDIDSRETSPFFLYVTPVSNPKRSTDDKYVVYCFNRDLSWPENWEKQFTKKPSELPVYDKIKGTSELFKTRATKPRGIVDIEKSLVSVLSKGYPNSKLGLSDDSARKVTQLAIWYFSDNFKKEDFEKNYHLSTEENQALQNLIEAGENPNLSETQKQQTLDLYIYNSGGTEHSGGYQNLLGSSLIPKTPEQPQPNTPDIDVEIIQPKIPEEKLVDPELPESKPKPTPKPEIPKEEELGTVIGGGNVVETTEDTATGSQGGAHNGVVSIQENKDPIVEETYESPLPGQSGQSGSKTEVEDTKGLEVIIGGQGEVVDIEETLPTEQGQSGSATEVEDTKGPDVIVGGQGQIVETEESLSSEQGQSGSTTEVEDTKGADVMIGGQGEIVDFEENLSGEQGQSGSATEVEDTKGLDVIIGGQGEIVEFEETLPTEHGQSGSTTEVEDSKPKISIHFDNEWPKEEKPQLPAVEKPKAKVSLPATGEAEHVLSTIVGAMILFLVSLWVFLKRKASKA